MSNHNEKYEKLAQVIREHREQKGALMPVLQAAQNIFGCVRSMCRRSSRTGWALRSARYTA